MDRHQSRKIESAKANNSNINNNIIMLATYPKSGASAPKFGACRMFFVLMQLQAYCAGCGIFCRCGPVLPNGIKAQGQVSDSGK
jgi:hypothetical protein